MCDDNLVLAEYLPLCLREIHMIPGAGLTEKFVSFDREGNEQFVRQVPDLKFNLTHCVRYVWRAVIKHAPMLSRSA